MSRVLKAPALAACLEGGEAGLFPTDTLPALATKPQSAEKLWILKQRPANKPLILMAAQEADLWDCLGVTPHEAWHKLAAQHWPGALTLVVPACTPELQRLNPAGDSLGLRVPHCSSAQELLAYSGPLATSSANLSGQAPCLTPEQAGAQFPSVALLGPLPWPAPSGLASTVVRWRETQADWELLRPRSGASLVSALLAVLLLLLSLHHWLMEPLLAVGESVLELGVLPWLALATVSWILAGSSNAER